MGCNEGHELSLPPTQQTCEEQARLIAGGDDAAIDKFVKVDNFTPEGFPCRGEVPTMSVASLPNSACAMSALLSPNKTIGSVSPRLIFPDCKSVRTSNSSSNVPKPPGQATRARPEKEGVGVNEIARGQPHPPSASLGQHKAYLRLKK
jgi:hypothetical protein